MLKLGGELLEDDDAMRRIARTIARVAQRIRLTIVHGGGKEIDAALAQAGIPKQQVDGLRITDDRTLQVVVAVLAGAINTRFVAAINASGGRAVGLTGADAGMGLVRAAQPHRATNGQTVDLGRVGEPVAGDEAPLLTTLARNKFVPVIACIGRDRNGTLFNVNADTLAAGVAARTKATRLIFAGGTAGVFDANNQTIATLTREGINELVGSGTATAGMIAKLSACRAALIDGVASVRIVDGRLLDAAHGVDDAPGSHLSAPAPVASAHS